eukprot:CAMPEP_0113229620 /NCGR_PEP_ID=MMETSP0008_2-20120614/449_1 /TAXON_ID=97485 /ORGANISM="Prymnesium parvum" /LENGTH=59 /DNA_ID=CAMNT_0000076151 /DNA_START=479 /DNA_END=658 /DNA_ORIENTATION=- /assembly_acc=CAM_ASM_000153
MLPTVRSIVKISPEFERSWPYLTWANSSGRLARGGLGSSFFPAASLRSLCTQKAAAAWP